MQIDAIGFNQEWAASISQDDFLKEMEGEGYKHIYEGKGRKEKLINAYKLLTKKEEAPKTEVSK